MDSPLAALRALGGWLHPASVAPRHSVAEATLRLRAGIVGAAIIVVGGAALSWALIEVLFGPPGQQLRTDSFVAATLPASIIVVLVSVFAPQAVFRTRNAAQTERALSNPSAPVEPWRNSLITFNAILVGAMVAGVYFAPMLTMAFFGLFITVRVVFRSRRDRPGDANARFHALIAGASAASIAAVAYAIVYPSAVSVTLDRSIGPLLLASFVALYVELLFNALTRWVNAERASWAFLRDAVDTRRILVALVSAGIAWLVCVAAELGPLVWPQRPATGGSLAALGCFLAAWFTLWVVSITMWRREALRTLTRWSQHHIEVLGRMADGSLDPELAARASVAVTGRMALSVFGAQRAIVRVDDSSRSPVRYEVTAGIIDAGAGAESAARATTLSLMGAPDAPARDSVTVAGCLPTGWFMLRSANIVERFRELASASLVTPLLARDGREAARAFESLFDATHGWPTLQAFEQAVDRLRYQVEASPQSLSLLMGVYSIDDFGALSGGRFEQAAVAQVMRLAAGFRDFAGQVAFVAYEAPGRIWIALLGGPMIRTGIASLRDLQQHINDHGAVQSARMDVDVHVSVSFGYSVFQVDDFAYDGLRESAEARLAIDEAARNPFAPGVVATFDIRPEDIIAGTDSPVTVDLTAALAHDRTSTDVATLFPAHAVPVRSLDGSDLVALALEVGWQRTGSSLPITDPRELERIASRQLGLAVELARLLLDRAKSALTDLAEHGLAEVPVMVPMPSILLDPQCGTDALPNLVTPVLDRSECARTVVVFDTIPAGGGQALHLLADRGIRIAVTAAAAATTDARDLEGWRRWAIVLPAAMVEGPQGVDGLLVHQTVSAIATSGTRLIAVAQRSVDARTLEAHGITSVLDKSRDGLPLDGATPWDELTRAATA